MSPRFAPNTWIGRFIENSRSLRSLKEERRGQSLSVPLSPATMFHEAMILAKRDALLDEARVNLHRWANDEDRSS